MDRHSSRRIQRYTGLRSNSVKKLNDHSFFGNSFYHWAMEDSGLKINDKNAHRVGCITGSGLGGLGMLEHFHSVLMEKGPRRISLFFIPGVIANMAPGQIAIEFSAKGPNLSIETACAASTYAVGEAFRLIRDGISDAMINGGAEIETCQPTVIFAE